MKLDHRDKGYAWVVVGASAVVMFVGPSTYTAYGTLFEPVEMESGYRFWILNLTCILWFGIGILAGPLGTLNTNRKLVMFGLFSTTCGLTLTGISFPYSLWSLLTFSILVGVGIGLAVHETFLLIVGHFEKHRGLVIGILQLSALLGQIFTPLIYKALSEVKDRCYIRALMSAIAFMSASFYISPQILTILEDEGFQDIGQRVSITSDSQNETTRKSSDDSIGRDRNQNQSDEPHSLVPLRVHQHPKHINKQPHPPPTNDLFHHQSHNNHMDSSFFLPNIPEEAESMTSIGSSSCSPDEIIQKFKISPIDPELERRITLKINKSISSEDTELKFSRPNIVHRIKPLDQELVKKVEETIKGQRNLVKQNIRVRANTTSDCTAREIPKKAMFRYRLDSFFDPEIDFMEFTRKSSGGGAGVEREVEESSYVYIWKEALESTDWKLLYDWRFFKMVLFSSLVVVLFPMFPVIISSHLLAIGNDNSSIELNPHALETDSEYRFKNVELTLIMIYVADGIARLVVGYISDFYFFSRQVGFFSASLIGGCLIVGVCFVKDFRIVYIISCLYGICYGTLVVTEALMFADLFGIEKLPTTYGLMNGVKALLILILTPLINSPVASFIYTLQPFVTLINSNETVCNGCDPFDILNPTENYEVTFQKTALLFLWIGIPGIFSGIVWIFEFFWYLLSAWKKTRDSEAEYNRKDTYSLPAPRRSRSNSNSI